MVLLSNVALASRSVRRPLTSALLDARSAAIATVFAWRFDVSAECESTSARRPLTSDAFVTVFDAVLAIAVSRLELSDYVGVRVTERRNDAVDSA